MMDKKKPPVAEGPSDSQAIASAPDLPQATENSQKKRSSARFTSFFHLLFYANPTWLDVLLISLGTFAAIAAGVPFPLMGILFGQLVDDINGATCENETAGNADSYRNGVNQKVLQLVYIGIAAFFVVYAYMLCWKIAGQRLVQRLQERYFASLLSQDIEFFDVRQAGELTSQLHGSVQIIQSGTSEKVGIFISTISFFITAYIVGFIKYPQLTGILISLIPALVLSSLISGHFIEKFTNRTAEFNHAASSIASEALSQLAVVQAFGAESRLEAKFMGLASTAKKEGIKKSYFAASQAGLLYFFSFSANALAFWKGTAAIAAAYEGAGDNISVGAVYTVVFLIVDACTLLGQVAPLLPMFGSAAAAFRKLEEDMNRQPVTYLDRGDDEPFSLQGPASVEFCDVSFAYPMRPTQTVLNGLSLACPFGKHTAIIGSSGSGKSTIAALMTRFYEPKTGKILLAGQDTKDFDVRDLRSFISLVQQEAPLFDRSILENIALGLINSPRPEHRSLREIIMGPDLSLLAADVRNGSNLVDRAQHYGAEITRIVDLVIDAARSADAFDFIDNLDFGFGTSAGTGGKSLSGGQKQRVALARALVKNPSVLILDEATSSLDAESEHRIRLAIDKICHDRTVISIAHRLSTIKDADNIIVLTPEGIAEQGTHEELLTFGGIYARLTSLQNSSKNFDHSNRQSFETDIDSIKPVDGQTSTDGRPSYDPVPAHESKEVKIATPEEIPNDGPKYSTWRVMRVLLKMMRDRSLWLAAAVVAAFIVGCTYTGSGFIFGYAVGVSSPCNAPSVIASQGRFFAGMFFVLAVVEGLANLLSWSAFGYMAESMLYRMRTRSFHSLLQKSLDWHHSGGRTSSTLLSLITKDCAAVGGLSGSVVGTSFAICVNIVAAIVVSHIVAWKIAVVCIIICPIFLAAGVLQLRVLAKFDKQHAAAYAQADSISTGAINSMKAVAALSLEEEVLGTYKRALKAPNKAITKAGAVSILWLTLGFSTGNFLYSFAYWWGSTLIIKGEYTPSEFLTALVALLVGSQMWSQLLVLIPEISAALTSSLRVFNTLDIGDESEGATIASYRNSESVREKDIEASAESRTVPDGTGAGVSVAFENVSFAYAARVDSVVLHNVSFVVRPGQFCGLVGPSGSGKSTVMNLVQRLYRPSEGTVKINGYDLSRFSGNEFRDDIAVVPQESALFDGSVRFNVGLGARTDRDATDEEIEQACRLANIHETIISLPQGYDTECGPNGMHFSGGQRQRLSIARALVRKPRLLLLDESTSALDAENEEALQKSLQQAARDMTVFVIAHKINTIKAADVIFVLEKGRIENSGTHVDLMETSRTYRAYVEQQMLQG